VNAETAAALREPFAKELVGKLPRLTCRACRDGKGECQNHKKVKCNGCNNWISPAHIHLDYVGHAEVTDRLLSVDPEWTWEPLAFGPDGLPAFDKHGGLWIRLTVAGVMRLGYGSADGKNGPDAVKECIGDAIRNASMRSGVGLDLWGARFKGEDDHDEAEQDDGTSPAAIELFAAVMDAPDENGLRRAWESIRADGRISEREREQLNAHVRRRKSELEARGDSTGDGAGSGAVPGPTVAGAGPDSEGAENGGPGRDREEGSLRPGVQPGVSRGDGSGGAAQAPGDRRGASATAGGRRG
jgi:hypothetical protein